MLTSALASAGSLPLAHNAEHSPTSIFVRHALLRMRARGRDACTFVARWKDGRGETSRSTPAYSEPWMRRERINVSVHSIYAILCRSPRQTKRLGLCCLVVFQYFMPLPSYHSHTMLFIARGICLRTLRISSIYYVRRVGRSL